MSGLVGHRLGVAQVECASGEVETNLATCLEMIEEARSRNVNAIIFPELALTGAELEGRVTEVARTLDSPELRTLADASRDMTIVIGFVEEGSDARFYNSIACLENGGVLHVHRKVYLVNYGALSEGRLFATGSRVSAFDTAVGRVGALICEDIWHPTLPYLVALDGAQMLVTCAGSPEGLVADSASSRELWSVVLRSHALTFGCFHIFANRAGREGALSFWGGSMVWGPEGALLASAESSAPTLVIAEVDPAAVRRQRSRAPFLRDERVDLTMRELDRIGSRRMAASSGPEEDWT